MNIKVKRYVEKLAGMTDKEFWENFPQEWEKVSDSIKNPPKKGPRYVRCPKCGYLLGNHK